MQTDRPSPRIDLGTRAYDGAVAVVDRLGLARLRRDLSRGIDGRVLELGVGSGRQLPHHPAHAEVTAIDPDRSALGFAARRSPHVRLMHAEAEELPFGDGEFDWVVSALVLCTVRDPGVVLGEVRRVLRPGGRLRALEHVVSPRPTLARVQRVLNPAWGRMAGGCRLDRDTEGAIAAAGLAITSRSEHLAGHVLLLEARRG